MIEFTLPSLGADMDEGKLLEWKIKPGDAVKRGDVVAVVDTAKAAVDVECWANGTVHELLIEVGDKVPVGTPIATLLEEGETPVTAKPPKPQPPVIPRPEPAVQAGEMLAAPSGARQRISPVARKRAMALGVDLDQLHGSGPGGAITLQDIEAGAQATSTDRNAQMRQAIATAMSRSKREIPHYYLQETVPMRHALDWLQTNNAGLPVTERMLPAVLMLKAVALATRKYPELNGFWVDSTFHSAPAAHVGVAISLRQGGLIAPALHDVADKPLSQLMQELTDLIKRARAGSLRSSEMADPTITVTNLGDQGVQAVFGVIYPPQVALVGFGRIVEQPWVEDSTLTVCPVVTASLAGDHRASDGHRGGLFLAEIHDLLQQPERL